MSPIASTTTGPLHPLVEIRSAKRVAFLSGGDERIRPVGGVGGQVVEETWPDGFRQDQGPNPGPGLRRPDNVALAGGFNE